MPKNIQYAMLYNSYEWYVPHHFNIAHACCHRWAASPHEARQAAIYFEDQVGQLTSLSYGQLSDRVNKLANGFIRMGVKPQDRIIIALQHSAETAITILAALSVGAIAVPLKAGLSHSDYDKRLIDAVAKIAIVDKHTISAITHAIDHSPILRQNMKQIIGINTDDERVIPWRTLLARQSTQFTISPTRPSTPAILFYPDNTKDIRGTIVTHEALIGALPGFVSSQNWFPKASDIFYTTYDWSSFLGLLGALLPTLYFGKTIVGCPSGRTIPRLFTLLAHYPITNILASGAELQRIYQYKDPLTHFDLALRCIACPADESSPEISDWVKERFDIHLNHICMPLGFSYIVGESAEKWESRAGSMGRAIPGHKVTVRDRQSVPMRTNMAGYIWVHHENKPHDTNPAISRHFWSRGRLQQIRPAIGDWYNTGIPARLDEDGYFWQAPHLPETD